MFIPPYDLLAVIRKMRGNVSFFNPASGKQSNLPEKRLVQLPVCAAEQSGL